MQKEFWDNRWENMEIGWDLGNVSPPIKAYIDQLTDKKKRILIPGCGNAYEAEYLWENGFENTFIVEISKGAIDSFKKRYPLFPETHIFYKDFFDLDEKFDLVFEQTFFCAIHPEKRKAYAKKMHEIINLGGKLVGLLFDFPLETGPPFGGSEEEYREYFERGFEIHTMEHSYNSVKPRLGREFFIIMEVK